MECLQVLALGEKVWLPCGKSRIRRGKEGLPGQREPIGRCQSEPLTALSFSFCTNSAPGTPVTFRIWVSWSRSWQPVKAQPCFLRCSELACPASSLALASLADTPGSAPPNHGRLLARLEQDPGGLPDRQLRSGGGYLDPRHQIPLPCSLCILS